MNNQHEYQVHLGYSNVVIQKLAHLMEKQIAQKMFKIKVECSRDDVDMVEIINSARSKIQNIINDVVDKGKAIKEKI